MECGGGGESRVWMKKKTFCNNCYFFCRGNAIFKVELLSSLSLTERLKKFLFFWKVLRSFEKVFFFFLCWIFYFSLPPFCFPLQSPPLHLRVLFRQLKTKNNSFWCFRFNFKISFSRFAFCFFFFSFNKFLFKQNFWAWFEFFFFDAKIGWKKWNEVFKIT